MTINNATKFLTGLSAMIYTWPSFYRLSDGRYAALTLSPKATDLIDTGVFLETFLLPEGDQIVAWCRDNDIEIRTESGRITPILKTDEDKIAFTLRWGDRPL